MIGYSVKLVAKNEEADPMHIGVRLGRACIYHAIPVSAVADRFGVTRQTVYNWFSGVGTPADHVVHEIEHFLVSLS